MIANLLFLNNEEPNEKIDKTVFEDLGFLDWSDACSHPLYTEILECMQKMPSKESILLRQRVFADVLTWEETFVLWTERFNKVIEYYEEYKKSKYPFSKASNFLIFFTHYVAYLEEVVKWNEEMPLQSQELQAYVQEAKAFLEAQAYAKLKNEMDEANVALNEILSFAVGNTGKMLQVESVEAKESLEFKLSQIAKNLDIALYGMRRNQMKTTINSALLEGSLKIHPAQTKIVKEFFNQHKQIMFDYEAMQFAFTFYFFFYRLFAKVKEENIPISKSKISEDKNISFDEVYDVVLLTEKSSIVPNDVLISKKHPIQLITGVNSGGKTSYLRAIGLNILLHLYCGHTFSKSASIPIIPTFFTHFPLDENFRVGLGRLRDELRRLEEVSKHLHVGSLIILNETFSSTDEDTALNYTRPLLDDLLQKDVFVLFVTHQQKLFSSLLDERMIIMSPEIDTLNKNKRLYKIGIAKDKAASYAYDILYQYKLTKKQLEKRLEKDHEK